MNKITVVMSICGHEDYYQFSKISVPSLMYNNPDCRLLIVTDDIIKIIKTFRTYPFFTRIEFVDFHIAYEYIADKVQNILDRTSKKIEHLGIAQKKGYHGRVHKHEFVSLLLPIAQELCKTEWILKIDTDSYFTGNMIGELNEIIDEDTIADSYLDGEDNGTEIDYIENLYDLYIVRRNHPKMIVYPAWSGRYIPDQERPGIGFYMWRKQSTVMDKYIKLFRDDEQFTGIVILAGKGEAKFKLLEKPNYHIVYPFEQAERVGKIINKEYLQEFTKMGGCYFHVGHDNVIGKLVTLKEWFPYTKEGKK